MFSPTHHPQFIRDKFGSEYLDKDVVDQITSASGSVHRVNLLGSDSDWIEPSDYLCNSQPHGCERVYDAFHLLQNESSVQVRILISQHTRIHLVFVFLTFDLADDCDIRVFSCVENGGFIVV